MTVHAQYAAKRVTPAEAIRNIHNGDTIVVPTAVAEPPAQVYAQRRQLVQGLMAGAA